MKDLSPRQKKIIDFIRSEVRHKGYPPSVREIGEAVGLRSSSTVHAHLEKLESMGYIRRDPTKPRAIEVTDGSSPQTPIGMISLPLLGKVTAGEPILAEQNIEQFINVPSDFVRGNSAQFVLRVKGESMLNAGILDGDLILVRQQSWADNGDIVVAMLEDEATVKRFFRDKDAIRLQPENPQYAPIITRDVVILGKVTGVFRVL
jgi:repressor LexA